jgi:hypothetical protein
MQGLSAHAAHATEKMPPLPSPRITCIKLHPPPCPPHPSQAVPLNTDMLVSLKPELQKLLGSWQVPQQVLDAVAAACIANTDLADSLAKVGAGACWPYTRQHMPCCCCKRLSFVALLQHMVWHMPCTCHAAYTAGYVVDICQLWAACFHPTLTPCTLHTLPLHQPLTTPYTPPSATGAPGPAG